MVKGLRLGAVASNQRQEAQECLFTLIRLVVLAGPAGHGVGRSANWWPVATADGLRIPDTVVRHVGDAFAAADKNIL